MGSLMKDPETGPGPEPDEERAMDLWVHVCGLVFVRFLRHLRWAPWK